jgi:hypothetical protein
VVLDQNGPVEPAAPPVDLWLQPPEPPEAKQMGIDENMKPKGTECCQKNTCLPEKNEVKPGWMR